MKNTIPSILLLTTILAACGDGDDGADAHGNFEAVETLVSARGSGELLSFRVEEGLLLEAGAPVGLIDTVMPALLLAQAEAERAATGSRSGDLAAQLAVQDARIADLQREEARLARLVAGKAATQKQLDDMRGQIAIQQRQLAALEAQNPGITAQVRAMDARIALLRRQVEDQHVVNPVRGVVVAKLVEPHELVAPGRPLYRLAAMDTLELRAYISGAHLGEVATGRPVEVGVDGPDGGIVRLPGRVSWVSSEAEFTPKTIQTREERVDMVYAFKVRVANTDGLLKSGMPGDVHLQPTTP